MVNWSDPIEIARQLQAAKYMVMICLRAHFCDTMHTLRFDWDILTGRKGSRRWPQLLYFIAKLGFWPYIAVTFAVAEPPAYLDCNTLTFVSEAFMGIITCCCSGLLAFRAVAVWTGKARKVVTPVVIVLWLALLGIWMGGVPDVKATWVEGMGPLWNKNQGTCTFLPIPYKLYGAKFIATVIFDFIVLMLTVVGVAKMNGRSRIGTILIEQGIFYFAATLLFNTLLVGFTYANLNPLMMNILNVPTQTVSLMAATRLYVMLCEKVRPGQVSSGNNSSGLGSSYQTSSFGTKSNGSSTMEKVRQTLTLGKFSGANKRASQYQTNNTFGVQSHAEAAASNATVDGDAASFQKGMPSMDDLEAGRHEGHPYAVSKTIRKSSDINRRPEILVSQETTVEMDRMPSYLAGMNDLQKEDKH